MSKNEIKNNVTTNLKVRNNVIQGTLGVDGFIIPNSPIDLGMALSSTQKNIDRICNINNIADNTKAIQIWSVSSDCNNIPDHGILINDKYYHIRIGLLPAALFAGKKEGDHVTFNYVDDDVDITVDMYLNQKDYRYGRFGTFEEVFQKLMH